MPRGSAGLGKTAPKPVAPTDTQATTSSVGSDVMALLRERGSASFNRGGTELEIEMRRIAPNPDNPRSQLRNIDGMAASIKEFGLIQPVALVPKEAWLKEHPHHEEVLGNPTVEFVVSAGHRRHAAFEQLGLTAIPAVVRESNAERRKAALIPIIENAHREDLAPVDQAVQFQVLADLEMSQREIAKATQFSQAHISKRLSLLGLSDALKAAVNTYAIELAHALVLVKAHEAILGEGADELTEEERWAWQERAVVLMDKHDWPATSAVAHLAREYKQAQAVSAAETSLAAAGTPIIDPAQLFGEAANEHRLASEDEVLAAEAAGEDVLASVDSEGQISYFSKNLSTTAPKPELDVSGTAPTESANKTADNVAPTRNTPQSEQPWSVASERREKILIEIVGRRPGAAEIAQQLAQHVLTEGARHREVRRLAHALLAGLSVGPDQSSPVEWEKAVRTDRDHRTVEQAAVAYAWAARELRARSDPEHWDVEVVNYLETLMRDHGWTPTEDEQRWIADAKAKASTDSTESPTINEETSA